MDERRMIIGLAIVLVLVGAYFVTGQASPCTTNADCGCGDCILDASGIGYCDYSNLECGTNADCNSGCICWMGGCILGECSADSDCGACDYCLVEGFTCEPRDCQTNLDCPGSCPVCSGGYCTQDPCYGVTCGPCEYCSGGICYSTCDGCESCVGGVCVDYDGKCGECGNCIDSECTQNNSKCGICDYCGEDFNCAPCDCSEVPECPPGCVCDDGSCFEGNCVQDTDCTGTCERCSEYECTTACETDENCPDKCICSNGVCVRPITPPSPDTCKNVDMGVSVKVGCEENVVTVTDNGNRLSGVEVRILRPGDTLIGITNASGEFGFVEISGANIEVKAFGFKTGGICYNAPLKTTATLKSAGECAPEQPECTGDADCPANYTCENGKCILKPEEPPEPGPECSADGDCASDSFCTGGVCVPATGICGYADNHTWVSYECCTDEDCIVKLGQDYYCAGNICIEREYNLTGEDGFLGDDGSVTAFAEGLLLPNAGLRVTHPDGTYEVLTTDSKGQVTLTFLQAGVYRFDLFVNGTIKKTLELTAVPKTPADPARPDFFDVLAQQSWILLIALLVILALIYWFYIAPKGKKKK